MDAQPPLPGEDEAAGDDQHRKRVGIVQGHMKRLSYAVDDSDRKERMIVLATLAGLADTDGFDSTGDFTEDELKTIADTLARCRDRAALDALLGTGESDA
jgi:hypothetical protein